MILDNDDIHVFAFDRASGTEGHDHIVLLFCNPPRSSDKGGSSRGGDALVVCKTTDQSTAHARASNVTSTDSRKLHSSQDDVAKPGAQYTGKARSSLPVRKRSRQLRIAVNVDTRVNT